MPEGRSGFHTKALFSQPDYLPIAVPLRAKGAGLVNFAPVKSAAGSHTLLTSHNPGRATPGGEAGDGKSGSGSAVQSIIHCDCQFPALESSLCRGVRNRGQQVTYRPKFRGDIRKLWLAKNIIPFLSAARTRGFRRIDDLLRVVNEERAKVYPSRKKISRSAFYRALKALRALGVDPGPDNRSVARKYGRPTRGHGRELSAPPPS